MIRSIIATIALLLAATPTVVIGAQRPLVVAAASATAEPTLQLFASEAEASAGTQKRPVVGS